MKGKTFQRRDTELERAERKNLELCHQDSKATEIKIILRFS